MKNVTLLFFIMMYVPGMFYGAIGDNSADLSGNSRWTWLFKHDLSKEMMNKNKSEVMFCKTGVPFFNQLIFSWNGFKPSTGYLSFFAQVRDAQTGCWHDWHQMIDWGVDVQKSYFNRAESGTQYCYVRLEMPPCKFADGLRIKAVACAGASLEFLASINACISNLKEFKQNHDAISLEQLPSVQVGAVPQQSQMILEHPKADSICSPTSCSMVTTFLAKRAIDPVSFADAVYDQGLGAYGSWPFNTAHAFEQCRGDFYFRVARLNSFIDVHKSLKKKLPVVVSVRGRLKGAPKEYNKGHLLVVVGWDQEKKKVICHDPAFDANEKVYVEYDFDAFCAAWARSHHLAYITEPKTI